MSLNTTIDPPTDSLSEVTPVVAVPAAVARPTTGWLRAHIKAFARATTAAGFALRIAAAMRTYLNPDEILHYLIVDQPSLLLAYKTSLTNAHPPLIYVLLYFCHLVGRSEVVLRLPVILAGTAFCWFTFEWVQLLFGGPAGLIALILVTFSPIMINLSAEGRQYALFLCFMAAALYFLQSAFERKTPRGMLRFSLFLY